MTSSSSKSSLASQLAALQADVADLAAAFDGHGGGAAGADKAGREGAEIWDGTGGVNDGEDSGKLGRGGGGREVSGGGAIFFWIFWFVRRRTLLFFLLGFFRAPLSSPLPAFLPPAAPLFPSILVPSWQARVQAFVFMRTFNSCSDGGRDTW